MSFEGVTNILFSHGNSYSVQNQKPPEKKQQPQTTGDMGPKKLTNALSFSRSLSPDFRNIRDFPSAKLLESSSTKRGIEPKDVIATPGDLRSHRPLGTTKSMAMYLGKRNIGKQSG